MIFGYRVARQLGPYVDIAVQFEDGGSQTPIEGNPPEKIVFAHGKSEEDAWSKVERYVAKTAFDDIEDRIILH
jgi:hypothetical protein